MAQIARDVTWLIGRTPLLELGRLAPRAGARLLAKLEAFNPTGSNKDRAALAMVEQAERSGFLKPTTTVVESSAGDTGMSLAMVCAARGYRLVLTMPDGAARARCNLLRSLGAEIVTTPGEHGIRGAMERAEELARELGDALILQPFANAANADGHAETTAREIWEDTDGAVDVVVCPAGTGGTAAGCARFFGARAPRVEVVAVEPAACAVLGGGAPGPHDIPGIGPGFVPDILCPADLARIVAVTEADAFAATRALAAQQAVLVGPASGAVLHAALEIAAEPGRAEDTVVAILPDPGERYEDHRVYAEQR